ncbi:heterokaryon incompatibility protein-domain-containing protein [Xylariales sp. PMI_506]|nr:heterokaryon incompatibility protein-domain-containing protein [Xylariales sp. PMI_506]
MPTPDPIPAAKLCARCAAVQFDDTEFDGFQSESAGGQHCVDFPSQSESDSSMKLEFKVDFELDDSFPHLAALAEGAAGGCDFCAYLNRLLTSDEVQCRLRDNLPDWEYQELPVTMFLYYRWGSWLDVIGRDSNLADEVGLDSLVLYLYMDTGNVQTIDETQILEMDIIMAVDTVPEGAQDDQDPSTAWLRISPVPDTNHLDSSKIEWMRTHLSDCYKGAHSSKCNPRHNNNHDHTDLLPTRLVDVSGPVPRLVYGSHILKRAGRHGENSALPLYAALSYCWGTASDADHQLKTETANESQMLAAIPTASMPKTLSDAVVLARALDIPYLWVDALCILQDDIQDWERESSNMGKVYSNAFVTLCALSASCHSSFLTPPSPRIVIPFQSSICDTVQGFYALRYHTILVAGQSRLHHFLPDVPNSRWMQRGWTHQEFAMSRRLLIFGPSYAHFLCPSITAAEEGDAEDGQWQFLLGGVSTDPAELYDEWGSSIVPVYSDRWFSKPHDALPALSGLAKYFADATGDEYIVGLWKRDLVRGLMWSHCQSPGPTIRRLDDLLSGYSSRSIYIAPSWSWIGHRVIEYNMYRSDRSDFRDFQPTFDIVATAEVQGENPYGQVSSAELRLTTQVRTFHNAAVTDQKGSNFRYNGELYLDEDTPISYSLDWRIVDHHLDGMFKLVVLGAVDWQALGDKKGRIANSEISGASNSTTHAINDSHTNNQEVYGLIVHAAREPDKFYRVGIFHSDPKRGGGMKLLETCTIETIYII